MSLIYKELTSKKFFEDRFYEVFLKIRNGVVNIEGIWERGQGFGDAHRWIVESVDGETYQSLIEGHDFYIGFWFYADSKTEAKLRGILGKIADIYHAYLREEANRILEASKTDWLNEHSSTPIA